MSAQLRVVTPRNDFRSVPVRPANSELRTREYLTPAEIKKLIKAATDGRWGHRDATLVLVAFRRFIWNAVVSMNTVPEYVALERLNYVQNRQSVDNESAQIRKAHQPLLDLC
jgi:hypothetical protein